MSQEKILGIDIGGTNVKVGALRKSGQGEFRLLTSVHFDKNPDQLFRQISSLIRREIPPDSIKGIGIAVAGDIDNEKGIVRFSPNFGWKNVPLRQLAARFFKTKNITIENDANAAAYGAYALEYRKKYPDLVCLTLGTGVGGGIIIDGKLYRGATGTAAELGHINYEPNGLKCTCGSRGCFERYLGRDAIVERALKKMPAILKENFKKNLTPFLISQKALEGKKWAQETWRETAQILGILLADIVNTLNPSAIVLTGGVANGIKFFIKETRNKMLEQTFDIPGRTVKIFISKKTDILGAAGAALLSESLLTNKNK